MNPQPAPARPREVRLALQLYTLRRACRADLTGTLRAVAEIGYRWVEPYEFFGLTARAFARLLERSGLRVASCHVGLDRLEGDLEGVLREQAAIGCRAIVCPWVEPSRRRGPGAFERLGRELNAVGRRLRGRGFRLLYHNHDFEFLAARRPDGLKRLLQAAAAANLAAQLDTYWLAHAGLDPVGYLRRLGGRVRSVHLKDRARGGRGFAPVGQGDLDMPGIIAAARRAGVRDFVVEQDECRGDPLRAVAASLAYLRRLGLAS